MYVYLGNSALDVEPDLIFSGIFHRENLGLDISAAGDINADSYPDFVFISSGYSVYLNQVFGAGNLEDIGYLPILEGDVGLSSGYGLSMSYGDFNNDGYSDISVSAPVKYQPENRARGSAFLYLGSEIGYNYKSEFKAVQKLEGFGYSVLMSNDLNNDGFDDLIVSSPHFIQNLELNPFQNFGEGKIQIIYGNTSDQVLVIEELINNEMILGGFGTELESIHGLTSDGKLNLLVGNVNSSRNGYLNGDVMIYEFDLTGTTILEEENSTLFNFELFNNYPNPFNPSTNIRFSLSESSVVSLTIYNTLGQEVLKSIESKQMNPGTYSVRFDASGFSSGVYYYRLKILSVTGKEFSSIKSMTLIK